MSLWSLCLHSICCSFIWWKHATGQIQRQYGKALSKGMGKLEERPELSVQLTCCFLILHYAEFISLSRQFQSWYFRLQMNCGNDVMCSLISIGRQWKQCETENWKVFMILGWPWGNIIGGTKWKQDHASRKWGDSHNIPCTQTTFPGSTQPASSR